jgi:membrane-associated HD superfamily phosphohydrolase
MKEFLENQKAGFYISIATIILALIAMSIYVANGNTTYYNDFNSRVVILTVIAIAVEIVLMAVSRIVGEKQWLDIAYIVVPVLLAITAMFFISYRVESAGIILGSDLEKGNITANNALNQAFMGIGFYFLAMISAIVRSFFSQIKD